MGITILMISDSWTRTLSNTSLTGNGGWYEQLLLEKTAQLLN